MMAQLRILPPAAKFLKKLKDKRLKALYQEAIDRILEDILPIFVIAGIIG